MEKSEKKFVTALLLAFFLGGFGAHRFYVGRTGSALAILFFSLSFFLLPISAIWVLVDIITIICGNFKDKEGKLVKE